MEIEKIEARVWGFPSLLREKGDSLRSVLLLCLLCHKRGSVIASVIAHRAACA